MSGSKAKVTGAPSSIKVGGVKASSVGSSSKKGGATTGAPAPSGIAGVVKTGPVQVFFNGKIVTPQSLIPRKTGHGGHGKKPKANIAKPQTIDENGSENADKLPPTSLPLKNMMKRNDSVLEYRSAGNVTGGVSKLNVLGKNKPVVEESINVFLTETPTQILLSLPSFIVASDTRDVVHTDERNARYEACVKAHKNVDGFASRLTQTKNNPLKHQNEMAVPNAYREFGSQAISYEIKDEIAQATVTNADQDLPTGLAVGTDTADDLSGLNAPVRKFVNDTVGVALVTPGCLLDTTTAVKPPAPGEYSQTAPKTKSNAKNKSMVSQRSMANSEAFSEDEGNLGGFAVSNNPKGGGNNTKAKKDDVSSASSGNNSQPDNTVVPPSGSKANVSQSRDGDSNNFDNSEDGNASKTYSGGATFTEEDSLQILQENEIKKILASPMLLKRLHMIERAIQQNANYRNQLDYRDLPDIPPLQLLSADRVKSIENTDQLFGVSSLGGKGGLKRAFTSGTEKSQRGLTLGHESSGFLNDGASTHSSDAGEGPGSVRLKAENIFNLDSTSKTKKLFQYSNPELIQGRVVTSMAWNAVSTDLLAVGYGRSLDLKKFQSNNTTSSNNNNNNSTAHNSHNNSHSQLPGTAVAESKEGNNNNTTTNANAPAANSNLIPNTNTDIPTDEAQEGLVLFWSLRNPDYPEKILRTSQSVTAVEFSKQNPMILAVGLANGDVNIYDVKRDGVSWQIPVESSAGMDGSHIDPVWQLKWIVKGAERLETLISISTDGRILEWNMKKGLVMTKLMQLKKSGTGEGWISNSAAGLCFDFHPTDPTTYVTGAEDGSVFRCSVSYNEQYLETYQGHEGPTYRLRFSNRWPNVFLSCSADWSMNLYHLNIKQSLLSIRATAENYAVNDICWCPDNATVFACVTMDAKLQIWDLSVSNIDPVVSLDIGSEDTPTTANSDHNNNNENNPNDPPRSAADLHSLPNSPAIGTRYGSDRFDPNNVNNNNNNNLTPVTRLLKSLAVDPKKRVLTTVAFGDHNPIIAVGDNRGNVTVYRVFDPVTITHLGPLQQFLKLKEAILRQTDPHHTPVLEADNGGYSSASIASSSNHGLGGGHPGLHASASGNSGIGQQSSSNLLQGASFPNTANSSFSAPVMGSPGERMRSASTHEIMN